MKKDELGNRMKEFYENVTRYSLPRKTYAIIRVDGKAFHTYTKGLNRPFDHELIMHMDQTAIYLCSKIQGAKFAYVQSDEISIMLTDLDDIKTGMWFDGNIQKMCSVSASMATSSFNSARSNLTFGNLTNKLAEFDARVFSIPTPIEVENYFIWRQQDAIRNSISSVAQSMFSHTQLQGKSAKDMLEMCADKGNPWENFALGLKHGRIITREPYKVGEAVRHKWVAYACPVIVENRNFLRSMIPQ